MADRIEGLDELMKKYGQLAEQVAGQAMQAAVTKANHRIQAEAKLLCPSDDGELRRSISVSTEVKDDRVIGTTYTNKSYAPYVEFGTGPVGAANHAGISPAVSPSYSQAPWWIHESQIGRDVAEKYGWFYIDTADGRFYQCSGQAAQPFMYPALKNNEDKATKDVAEILSAEIRRICGD